MRKTNKPKPGEVVQVVFLDHCENHPEPIEATVYGKVIASSLLSLTVGCWETSVEGMENTRYTLIRSCIKSMHVLT